MHKSHVRPVTYPASLQRVEYKICCPASPPPPVRTPSARWMLPGLCRSERRWSELSGLLSRSINPAKVRIAGGRSQSAQTLGFCLAEGRSRSSGDMATTALRGTSKQELISVAPSGYWPASTSWTRGIHKLIVKATVKKFFLLPPCLLYSFLTSSRMLRATPQCWRAGRNWRRLRKKGASPRRLP